MKRPQVRRDMMLIGLVVLGLSMGLAAQAGVYSCTGDDGDTSGTTAAAHWSPVGIGVRHLLSDADFDAVSYGAATRPSVPKSSAHASARSWTAFFVDSSLGLPPSKTKGFALEMTNPVPEPVGIALEIFGGLVVVVMVVGRRPVRARLHRMRNAIVDWINAV